MTLILTGVHVDTSHVMGFAISGKDDKHNTVYAIAIRKYRLLTSASLVVADVMDMLHYTLSINSLIS